MSPRGSALFASKQWHTFAISCPKAGPPRGLSEVLGPTATTQRATAREAMKERAGGGAAGRPNREEIIKRFDKSGVGRLSDDERAAARESRE